MLVRVRSKSVIAQLLVNEMAKDTRHRDARFTLALHSQQGRSALERRPR